MKRLSFFLIIAFVAVLSSVSTVLATSGVVHDWIVIGDTTASPPLTTSDDTLRFADGGTIKFDATGGMQAEGQLSLGSIGNGWLIFYQDSDAWLHSWGELTIHGDDTLNLETEGLLNSTGLVMLNEADLAIASFAGTGAAVDVSVQGLDSIPDFEAEGEFEYVSSAMISSRGDVLVGTVFDADPNTTDSLEPLLNAGMVCQQNGSVVIQLGSSL